MWSHTLRAKAEVEAENRLVTALIRTAILVGLSVAIAPAAGLNFGGLWSTVIKLAVIMVFADVLLMWCESLVENLDALPKGGRSFV